jgi:hypothetical protein
VFLASFKNADPTQVVVRGRGEYRVLVGKHEERNHLKDPGVDRRMILKCIFWRRDGDMD